MTNPIIKYIGPKGEYSNKVIYSTIEDCVEFCSKQKELGIDTESSRKYPANTFANEHIYKPGLDPYLSKVIMLQLGTKECIYVIDTRTEDITKLLPILNSKDILWIGHHLRFEAKHLQHNYGVLFHKIWDTMLVEQNLTNGLKLGYSLAKLAERYMGIKPAENIDLFNPVDEENEDYIDKSIRLEFLNIGDKLFTEDQILYGADDILYPLEIRKYQLKGYNGYNPTRVHNLENDFCLVLADIELAGMTFDKEQWIKQADKSEEIMKRRLQKLNQYVEKNHPKYCEIPDLFNPLSSGRCTIEWSSSKQVIKLFKDIGFCPKEKSKDTGRVEYTVGAKALVKLLPNDYKERYEKDQETDIVEQKDLILNYLLYTTAEQACTTFGKTWLKYIHPITGRVHSEYRQILNTSRVSSNRPNCQNLPADEEYRKAFIAQEGNTLINCDFASQESRCLAELSGDEAMISFFNNGHPIHGNDYHSFTATKMFSLMRNEPNLIISKETHPEERGAAKAISFKISYGGSSYTLKDDFGVEEEIAQEFIDSYFQAFPALDKYFKKGKENAIKNGYIEILPDRRYWERNFKRMKELNEKAWSLYPKDYSKLPDEKKKEVKAEVNKKHPELKQIWSEYFSLTGALGRASQNYPIQGVAAAQTKLAGVLFRKRQIEQGLRNKVWLINLIHDEAVAECTQEYAEEARKLVQECMVQGAQYYCKKVKMEAEALITPFWKH